MIGAGSGDKLGNNWLVASGLLTPYPPSLLSPNSTASIDPAGSASVAAASAAAAAAKGVFAGQLAHLSRLYLYSVYYAFTAMTTVGYTHTLERSYTHTLDSPTLCGNGLSLCLF